MLHDVMDGLVRNWRIELRDNYQKLCTFNKYFEQSIVVEHKQWNSLLLKTGNSYILELGLVSAHNTIRCEAYSSITPRRGASSS